MLLYRPLVKNTYVPSTQQRTPSGPHWIFYQTPKGCASGGLFPSCFLPHHSARNIVSYYLQDDWSVQRQVKRQHIGQLVFLSHSSLRLEAQSKLSLKSRLEFIRGLCTEPRERNKRAVSCFESVCEQRGTTDRGNGEFLRAFSRELFKQWKLCAAVTRVYRSVLTRAWCGDFCETSRSMNEEDAVTYGK